MPTRRLGAPCPRFILWCLFAKSVITENMVVGSFENNSFSGFGAAGIVASVVGMLTIGLAVPLRLTHRAWHRRPRIAQSEIRLLVSMGCRLRAATAIEANPLRPCARASM